MLLYREALWHGFSSLKNKPLGTNLFIDIVEIIKRKNIGIRKVPGTKIANSKGEVIYTPPDGESLIRDKLSNLEKFLHAEDEIDPLIKLAILHYQFEAIHPFIDGNGRTGRIMNILFLVEKGLLDSPILFLSHYILSTKATYYAGLRNVTEKNSWSEWILYVLEAIEATAVETHKRVSAILSAINEVMELVKRKAPKIYSKDLIDIIFTYPYCKISFLERSGIAKRQTASSYLKTLEELGVLQCVKIGRDQYYPNKKLIEILSR